MFERLRRRIFAAVILAAVILLVAMYITVFTTSLYDMRQHHIEEMHDTIHAVQKEERGEEEKENFAPKPNPNPGICVVKTTTEEDIFSFLKTSDSYSEEEMSEMAQKLSALSKESGVYKGMLFKKETEGETVYIAFMSDALQNRVMKVTLRNAVITGTSVLLVIIAAAWVFAGRVMGPLKENSETQKQFLSDAGHELKTPVAVISTNAELLSRQIGENQWLDNIVTENARMGKLVEDMLDLVRDRTKEETFEPLDLDRLIQGEVLLFESVAYEAGKRIEYTSGTELNAEVQRVQMERAIGILLDNAICYTKGEDPIAVFLTHSHKHAVVTVENLAEELSHEQITHLFDRFYRTDEARTGSQNHYGLGLPIAKKIIETHHGQIEAESKGGKFIIRFQIPLKQ